MSQKKKYLEEYEKYKHIVVSPGVYQHRERSDIKYDVSDVDTKTEKATVRTIHSGVSKQRTLHWCRKYLEKVTTLDDIEVPNDQRSRT